MALLDGMSNDRSAIRNLLTPLEALHRRLVVIVRMQTHLGFRALSLVKAQPGITAIRKHCRQYHNHGGCL